MTNYRWGIIGLGGIAHYFAKTFKNTESTIHGVASRSYETVKAFSKEFSIPNAYESTEDLLADEAIDFVYIAAPNNAHHEYVMAALQAGKHVLCEKAITRDYQELAEEVALANEKNLILQEAMTIFNMPLYTALKKQADSGKFGKLKMIQAPFGVYQNPDPKNRFFNPDLGGGALLDIGTYAVSFARYFLNENPEVLFSNVLPFETGVDEQSITVLRNSLDEMAVVTMAFQARFPIDGTVAYEHATISVPDYLRADTAEITYADGTKETVQVGDREKAFNYEVDNFIEAVKTGDNQTLPLTEDVIQILDGMRRFW